MDIKKFEKLEEIIKQGLDSDIWEPIETVKVRVWVWFWFYTIFNINVLNFHQFVGFGLSGWSQCPEISFSFFGSCFKICF